MEFKNRDWLRKLYDPETFARDRPLMVIHKGQSVGISEVIVENCIQSSKIYQEAVQCGHNQALHRYLAARRGCSSVMSVSHDEGWMFDPLESPRERPDPLKEALRLNMARVGATWHVVARDLWGNKPRPRLSDDEITENTKLIEDWSRQRSMRMRGGPPWLK